MAKSVRASVSKRNKAKLRATVFGPAVDARTERLSAKLQELASQPSPSDQGESNVESKSSTAGMFPSPGKSFLVAIPRLTKCRRKQGRRRSQTVRSK